ncbi:hypothetical protein H5410_062539 [Solanum commersonii]|uniref:Uncharacterized protein n=1 Tax=Solanum commersonii TaxID=4109 RepID=A0A9J5WB58_SOLCO|nr:hypothetical protein H5410_062539 [Solanum commersonii]
MKKGIISKSEAIALYMEEVKKDLMKNLDFDIKDDTSMASAIYTDDTCLGGEGQDIDDEEEDLETILKLKTTEETITIDSDNQTFRLLSDNDLAPYKDIYRFMHIGLVQCMKVLTIRVRPPHGVKEKIKNLDIDDNLKDSLYKIMLNSDSESGSAYNSREYSSTSEDLKALQQEEYLTSEDECSPCQQGMTCEKDDEDDLYKIYEQFKELSLNVIDNDKVIELLQNIKDPEIRAQITDKISDSKEKEHTENDYIPKEIPTKEELRLLGTFNHIVFTWQHCMKVLTIRVRPPHGMHYEMILSSTGCEFQHFYPANTKKVYNFSKLIIKRIIAPEEWGMSTLKEMDYFYQEQKVAVKYNYWDYIEGFNKVLLYENANRKHSWFIKICSNIFDRHVPNWFCKWWTLYGPSIKILPESYKKLYLEWVDISPKLIKMQEENIFFEGNVGHVFLYGILNSMDYEKYHTTPIKESQVIEESSLFKKIARKLQIKKGLISKFEAIAIYMEEVKKDLMKNLDIDIRDDISMISTSHTNEDEDAYMGGDCLGGEGQPDDEE